MGELENLQIEKTNCMLKRMRIEEELEKLKTAANAMWNIEERIEGDLNAAAEEFNLLGDWKGDVYAKFSADYHELFWGQYNTYTWELEDIALELDELCKRKEQEKADAEGEEQEIIRRIEDFLYEQGYVV